MVQVMVTEVVPMPVAVTAEITGPGALVENVKLVEVACVPPEFADSTAKSYRVPGVRPESATE